MGCVHCSVTFYSASVVYHLIFYHNGSFLRKPLIAYRFVVQTELCIHDWLYYSIFNIFLIGLYLLLQPKGPLVTELGVDLSLLPEGRFRLGVPCSFSKLILLDFATNQMVKKYGHKIRKSELSKHVQEKSKRKIASIYTENEYESSFRNGRKPGRNGRRSDDDRNGHYGQYSMVPKRPGVVPVPVSYRDLDAPEDNPWSGLAGEWGKRETVPLSDYEHLLNSHASVQQHHSQVCCIYLYYINKYLNLFISQNAGQCNKWGWNHLHHLLLFTPLMKL